MKKSVFVVLLSAFSIIAITARSQNTDALKNPYSLQELKSKMSQYKEKSNLPVAVIPVASKKSPALAVLFSLILPGAGHYYLDRMDVGKFFLGADAMSWIGLASLNIYGNSVRDDSRTFSHEHASVNNSGNKDDNYYASVGNYDNIYQYNNQMLLQGNYGNLYDVNQFFWNWDNTDNRNIYETQRKNSQRIYDSRVIFGGLLVANRIISAISAYAISTSKKSSKTSLYFRPEILYRNNYAFDGIQLNLSKNF